MRNIAYIANSFPSPVEPYVMDEIVELRRRGVTVIPCSVRKPRTLKGGVEAWSAETWYMQPLRFSLLLRAIWLCIRKAPALTGILKRVLFRGDESYSRRARAFVHTLLGVYLAAQLRESQVDHIHVHHGYFSCWIAMVASRLLGISYSVTLHGSDLLIHKAFLDTKLADCEFCATVSEFNRRYILDHYPEINPHKVFVRRMGVDVKSGPAEFAGGKSLIILAVGRLHLVKDYEFLINACAQLKQRGHAFACVIAGEGPERNMLQALIYDRCLEHEVILLGHLSGLRLETYYKNASLVALTSRSEGIPLSMMEAMARGKIVLAPAITGIPELIEDGETGFLFQQGSIDDFVAKVETIRDCPTAAIVRIRTSAMRLISEKYNRETNLAAFADLLLHRIARSEEIPPHENFVLQQI